MQEQKKQEPTDIICKQCKERLKFERIEAGKRVYSCWCGETVRRVVPRRQGHHSGGTIPPNSAA